MTQRELDKLRSDVETLKRKLAQSQGALQQLQGGDPKTVDQVAKEIDKLQKKKVKADKESRAKHETFTKANALALEKVI